MVLWIITVIKDIIIEDYVLLGGVIFSLMIFILGNFCFLQMFFFIIKMINFLKDFFIQILVILFILQSLNLLYYLVISMLGWLGRSSKAGSFIGYLLFGQFLYSFNIDVFARILYFIVIVMKNGLRQILEELDFRKIFYFLCINLVGFFFFVVYYIFMYVIFYEIIFVDIIWCVFVCICI